MVGTHEHARAAITRGIDFLLASQGGDKAIPGSWAAALSKAGQMRVTLTGPGISRVTAGCTWNAAAKHFQCTVKVPAATESQQAQPAGRRKRFVARASRKRLVIEQFDDLVSKYADYELRSTGQDH